MSANAIALAQERDERGRRASLVAWSAWTVAAVLFVAGEALAILNRTQGNDGWSDTSWLFIALAFAFAFVGALVLSHHPGHAIGWLLYVVGLFFELSFSATEYGLYTLHTNPGALPFGREVATIAWIGGTAFFMMTTLLLLLFPDGKPIAPRLNLFIWLGIFASALASLSEWFRPGPLDAPVEEWTNPLGIESARTLFEIGSTLGLALVAICGAVGAATLFIRFRRAQGIEREQLKWIAFSAIFFILMWFLQLIGAATGALSQPVRQALVGIGISTIPIAAGIAILRYRLYDIDWIINRTLVYVPLTAILAGVYIALTGAMRAVLADGTGSDFTVAMTTVIVVALLTPVKNYLQAHVDRLFKDAHEPAKELLTLARDTRAAYEVLDSQRLVQRLVEQMRDALEATGAEVILERGYEDAVWTCGDADGLAALEVPLRHESETLGMLRIGARESGRPYSAAECAAVQECADVIAYVWVTSERHGSTQRLRDESRSFSG
jgi:hypothetical protein